MRTTINRPLLLLAQATLGEELEEMVLVGGATVDLLAHDLAAADVRGTTDVDLLVQAVTRGELRDVEKRLGQRGLLHPMTDGAPICRWQKDGLILDVIPTESSLYGFGNRWLRTTYDTALLYQDEELRLRHASAACFVALKIEAFRSESRANRGDVHASHDLGDILAVFNGRPEAVREILASPPDLKEEIQAFFATLDARHDLAEIVESHLLEGRRIERVVQMCRTLGQV